MDNLFISRWWGNYIGGCDDSLLLLDYFGKSASETLTLRQILKDIHLDPELNFFLSLCFKFDLELFQNFSLFF